MRSSNVQGFSSKMLTLYEEDIELLLTVAKKRVCAPVAHKTYKLFSDTLFIENQNNIHSFSNNNIFIFILNILN